MLNQARGRLVRHARPESPGRLLTRRDLLGSLVGGASLLAAGVVLGRPLEGPLHLSGSDVAAVSPPRIFTRTLWQARFPVSIAEVLDTPPDHLVIHHMATDNVTDYSWPHASALSRWCQDLHMDTNGWNDAGQQFTISRGGHVMEGRNGSLRALQNRRHENSHTIGIENEGLYMTELPTTAQWNKLVGMCAYICQQYGLDPNTAIVGHRDYVATLCPGDALYARLPTLRADVATAMGLTAAAITPQSKTTLFDHGVGAPAARFPGDHGPATGSGEH